jgi:hypothetical protein
LKQRPDERAGVLFAQGAPARAQLVQQPQAQLARDYDCDRLSQERIKLFSFANKLVLCEQYIWPVKSG